MKTLSHRQELLQAIQALPDEAIDELIHFARYLQDKGATTQSSSLSSHRFLCLPYRRTFYELWPSIDVARVTRPFPQFDGDLSTRSEYAELSNHLPDLVELSRRWQKAAIAEEQLSPSANTMPVPVIPMDVGMDDPPTAIASILPAPSLPAVFLPVSFASGSNVSGGMTALAALAMSAGLSQHIATMSNDDYTSSIAFGQRQQAATVLIEQAVSLEIPVSLLADDPTVAIANAVPVLSDSVVISPFATLAGAAVGSGSTLIPPAAEEPVGDRAPVGIVYYVATNGSDDNAGTLDSPYQSLQHAIAQITDGGGGTIYVRGGTYQPDQTIWIGANHDGSASSPLVIRAYQNEKVIIDGSRMAADNNDGIEVSGSYVDLIGFEIQNIQGDGINIFDAAYVQILNNIVHNIQGGGIASFGSPSAVSDRNRNIVIDGNTVYRTNLLKGAYRDDPSVNWGMGISVGFSDDVIVTNNLVYHNYGEGIGFYVSTNSLAARNVVYDNYALGIYLDSSRDSVVNGNFIYNTGDPEYFRNGLPSNGIQMANETYSFMQYDRSPYHLINNQITNNIIVNVGTGIFYGTYSGFGNGSTANFYGMMDTTITNNTFYNPDVFMWIDADPNTANVTVANNIFARLPNANASNILAGIPDTNNIVVEYNLWSSSGWIEGNKSVLEGTNIQADPKFVNPGGLQAVDYQLQAGSPAIAAGSNRFSLSTDYFGQPRPANGGLDIGAYQVQYSLP